MAGPGNFELVCEHGYPPSGMTVPNCPNNCTVYDRMPGYTQPDRADPRALIRFGLERAAHALGLEDSERTRDAMMQMAEAYIAFLNSRQTVGGDIVMVSDENQIEGALAQVERILKRLR